MPGGNGAGSGGILCLDGLQQAGVVIQNCFCRAAAEAEHRGAVKMRGQIFHQLIPVRVTVEHDVFGRGLVLSVLPTGNDKMLEIAFDQIGTKRLMANFAASRMRKL